MPQCLFCHQTELTDEHIWPDWVVRLFKAVAPPQHGRFTKTRTRNRQPVETRLTHSITAKRPLVCDPCNSQWMSRTETRTIPVLEPLIKGAFVGPLSPTHSRILSQWVALRAMVFDSLEPDNPRYFSDLERATFAGTEGLILPPNTLVWVALYAGPDNTASFNVAHQISGTNNYGYYVMTAVLNRVALVFMTWRGHERIISDEAMEQSGWNVVSRLIWPATVGDWPPTRALTSRSWNEAVLRFGPRRP